MSLTVELIRVVRAVGASVTLLVPRDVVTITTHKLGPSLLLSLRVTASLVTMVSTLHHSVTSRGQRHTGAVITSHLRG